MTTTTTLQNHLTMAHLSIYIEACTSNRWDKRLKAARNLKINKDISQCEMPKYSKDMLLKALIAFIVANDQVCEYNNFECMIGLRC